MSDGLDAFEVYQRVKEHPLEENVEIPPFEFHVEQPDDSPEAVFEFAREPFTGPSIEKGLVVQEIQDAIGATRVSSYDSMSDGRIVMRFYFDGVDTAERHETGTITDEGVIDDFEAPDTEYVGDTEAFSTVPQNGYDTAKSAGAIPDRSDWTIPGGSTRMVIDEEPPGMDTIGLDEGPPQMSGMDFTTQEIDVHPAPLSGTFAVEVNGELRVISHESTLYELTDSHEIDDGAFVSPGTTDSERIAELEAKASEHLDDLFRYQREWLSRSHTLPFDEEEDGDD